jgi:hypothetical protein
LDSGKRDNNWSQQHVLVVLKRKFQAQFNKFKADTQKYLLRKLTVILNQKGQMIERDVESVVLRAIKRVMIRQQNIRIRYRDDDFDDEGAEGGGEEECTEEYCSISIGRGGRGRHTVTHHHRRISRRVIYPQRDGYYRGRPTGHISRGLGRRPMLVEQQAKVDEDSEQDSESDE